MNSLPHPSLSSHCQTEVAVLEQLRSRSRHQHRSQKFLRHLEHVVRLGRIFASRLNHNSIIRKLQHALRAAGKVSFVMVQMRHFLPLQTALIASYGRLYALTVRCLELPIAPKPGATATDPLPLTPVQQETPVAIVKTKKKQKKDAMDDIFGI